MSRSILLSTIAVAALLVACSSDSSSSSGSSSDPAATCASMCNKAGFSTSRADVQPNEINCFCTGAGTMTDAICKEGCTGLGKGKSEPFGGGTSGKKDACQCD